MQNMRHNYTDLAGKPEGIIFGY